MRKSSSMAAARRAGSKTPHAETEKEESNTSTPKTGPESTQKTEQVDPDPKVTPEGSDAGETDTCGSEDGTSETGGTATATESVEDWKRGLEDAVARINDLPPEIRSVLLGDTVPNGTPAQDPTAVTVELSKTAKARLRHHVRAAAGRLAASLDDVKEARNGWEHEVSEARKQGYPDAHILGQALDAGLEPDDVPTDPDK